MVSDHGRVLAEDRRLRLLLYLTVRFRSTVGQCKSRFDSDFSCWCSGNTVKPAAAEASLSGDIVRRSLSIPRGCSRTAIQAFSSMSLISSSLWQFLAVQFASYSSVSAAVPLPGRSYVAALISAYGCECTKGHGMLLWHLE